MQFVSNSDFEKKEFDEWFSATKTHGTIPTVDVVEKKQAGIMKALNHKYSDKEIDAMIQEKSKFQTVTRSYAMTKVNLSKEKELAQQRGDIQEAERIQNQIDEIEQYADDLDRERTKSIQAIAFINHRNRNQIKDQVLSGKLKIEENPQDDPFTRKRVSEAANEKSSSIAEPTPPPLRSKYQKNKTNMFSLHNFDLDIDFDKLKSCFLDVNDSLVDFE